MPYITFKEFNFREDTYKLISLCNSIIEEYLAQGLRLTLRQLYYQLVARDHIPNTERSYGKLSTVVSKGRLAGEIDWAAIEDRIRVPHKQNEFDDLKDLIRVAINSYRLPRWDGQDCYIELWVEKDALAGVLRPIADRHHITLMVNRGYSSQSAMYEAAERFRGKQDKECHLIYLGDLDPSGEDMVRDIGDRLYMFNVLVSVHKLALTMEQVQEYNPPPNPAKVTDPRAKDYIKKYGTSSWEVDALPPDVLTKMLDYEIGTYVNEKALKKVIAKEELDKRKLRGLVK